MAEKKHQPAPDASSEEWEPYLRGLRYVPTSKPSPITNYVAFHGFWVPPRMAPAAQPNGAEIVKRAPRRRKRPHGIDPAWYDLEQLALLHRHHRDVFDTLRSRIDAIEGGAGSTDPAGDLEAQRTRLTLAVETGMMNQESADQQLVEWAAARGVELPAR